MLKYSDESFLTENPFMDILVHNLKVLTYSCVIKDEYMANENETIESLKAADLFKACVEKRAELGLFPRIPTRFLEQVGMGQYEIIRYKTDYDWERIPEKYHKDLVELLIPWYIENIRGIPIGNLEQDDDYYNGQYVETNNYYRMLIGLPNYGEYGVAIQEFEYLIPDYVEYDKSVMYFHELPSEINREFERLGILDVVRAAYPKEKYLEYMSKDIDLYTARIKLDFQILWCTDEMNFPLTEEFKQRYAMNRKFMMTTVYSEAFGFGSPYYHSFMISYTLLITLLDMLCEIQVHIIRKDVLDRRCIAYIFSMYGLPYYRIIPIKYQERLCKQVHNLVKYKSCDRGFLSLINLFGFDNITCYKYFLVKDRKTNPWGEFEFADNLTWVCPENKYIKHISIEEDLAQEYSYMNESITEFYKKTAETIQASKVLNTYDVAELEEYFKFYLPAADITRKALVEASHQYIDIVEKVHLQEQEYQDLTNEYEQMLLKKNEIVLKEKLLRKEYKDKRIESNQQASDARKLVVKCKEDLDYAQEGLLKARQSARDEELSIMKEELRELDEEMNTIIALSKSTEEELSELNNKLEITQTEFDKATIKAAEWVECAQDIVDSLNAATTLASSNARIFNDLWEETTTDENYRYNYMVDFSQENYDKWSNINEKALQTFEITNHNFQQSVTRALKNTKEVVEGIVSLLVTKYMNEGLSSSRAISKARKEIEDKQLSKLIENLSKELRGYKSEQVLNLAEEILNGCKYGSLLSLNNEIDLVEDSDYLTRLANLDSQIQKAEKSVKNSTIWLDMAQQTKDHVFLQTLSDNTLLQATYEGWQLSVDNVNQLRLDSSTTVEQINAAQSDVAVAKLAYDNALTAFESSTTVLNTILKDYQKKEQEIADFKQQIEKLENRKLSSFKNDGITEWELKVAKAQKALDEANIARRKLVLERKEMIADYKERIKLAAKHTKEVKGQTLIAKTNQSISKKSLMILNDTKLEKERCFQEANKEALLYRYIPFPIPFFLQKGNVMFVRLNDVILTEGVDYEIVYYNTLKWKNHNIINWKTNLIYDFYYNEKTTNTFPTTQEYCVKTVQDDLIPLADKNTYSFYETALEEFMFSSTFKYLFCCDDEGVQINPCEWELDPHTGTVTLFPEEDEELANISFIDLQPRAFNILFHKAEVIATEEDKRLGSIPIPEPFPGYCVRGNTFLIKRVREENGKLKYGFFKTSGYKFKQLDETGARAKFTRIIGDSGSAGGNSIKEGDKYIFYFYYADMEHVSQIELKSKQVTLKQTSAYQYEYEIPDGFPVKHYIESGYQAYLKILDSWIPAKWFTILSNGTVILTNHSIAPQHLDRPIEIYLFYLEYDRTIYRNISVGKFHTIAEKDFQKEFTIEFPIDNYLERGNDYVIDMDGIYLEKTEDKSIPNRYSIKSQTSNSITIEIPNRDVRPMAGQRVNATFYYQTGKNEHRLGIYLDTLHSYINNDDEAIQTTTIFKSKDQTFFMKFPFYPYLETGHSFILTIGSKRINPDRLELVPGTLSTFRFKDLSDAEFKEIKGKRMYLTCFYNTWYLEHNIQGLTVETRKQEVTDGVIVLDTPAENYVENHWPIFVMDNNRYVSEDLYDIIYHTLYTSDYTSLTLVYIYIKAKEYIEYKELERYDDTTSLHFSHSDIRDLYQVEDIKDKANWKDYDAVTIMDGWWDGKKYIPGAHETIKQKIYEKKFNYERSKYYQVTVITSLSDYASQISYFYGMLYDDVLLEENVTILVPSISSIKRFKLSNLFIYLTTLTYLFNGFEDLIIEAPSKWLWIVGFNFKTDLADLKKYLYDNNRHYSDYRIWDWIKPTSQVEDIVKFVNIYQTNMKVKDIILKGLVNANDYSEWRIWKKLYDSLLIYKTNMNYFRLENGKLATSYTEFLKEKDPILYTSILKLKTITDQETLQDEIIRITDDVIFILSEYINGSYTSELFKELAGYDPMKAAKYINILIDFFKSYKIMLLDRTEEINVNDPNEPDNYFRPIDNIESMTEQTIQKDYIIPDERVTTIEHMQFHEWISVPNKTRQLIDFPYPTFNASHSRDEVSVEPAKFQPYHTDLPELTHIKNAGLWMREDVIIQPYLKEMIAKFINPCKININKLDYNMFLEGFLQHPKVYTPGMGEALDIEEDIKTGQAIIDKQFKTPEILSRIELKKKFYEMFLSGSTTIEKEWFSTEIKGYFKLMASLDYVNTLEDMYKDDLPRLIHMDDIIEELNRGIWDQSTREPAPYDFLVGFFSPAKALVSIHSLQFSYENDLAYDVLYYDTFERMCSEMTALKSFDCKLFQYFKDTTEDKNFKKLFFNCKQLKEMAGIDLADYPKGISTDIYQIRDKGAGQVIFEDAFYGCENLVIDCFRLSTYRPVNLQRAFYNCQHLTYIEGTNTIFIDIEAFTNVNMIETFYGTIRMKCIPEIYISNQISVKISDKPLKFIRYTGSIDLTRTFAYSGIEQYRREKLPMTRFEELRPLHLDDLKDMSRYSFIYLIHYPVDMTQTFYHCNYLQETVWLTIGSGESKVLNMTQTFAECDHLQRVRGFFFKGKLTINMDSTFKDCKHLLKLHPITLEEGCILNMNSTFENCTSLADIDEFFTEITDIDSNERGLYGIRGKVNLNSTFKNCLSLKEITLDATKLNNVSNIFSGCINLKKVTFLNPSPVQMVAFTHYTLDNSTLTYQIEFKNI